MIDDLLKKIGELDDALLSKKRLIDTLTIEYKDAQRQREGLASKAANEMIECGCTASEVDGIKWSIRNNPQKVVVSDETLIPQKFFKEKMTKSLNKTLLKAALNEGATIQGAHLDNGSISLVAKGKSNDLSK